MRLVILYLLVSDLLVVMSTFCCWLINLRCCVVISVCQVDPVVYNMLHEDPGNVSYSAVGGLSDQIRELRESIELPLMNPELFLRVGIKPPKVSYIVTHFNCNAVLLQLYLNANC